MRWDDLFADLEAEFEALEAAELAAEVTDRTRRELARIRLVDRLRAGSGADITVHVGDGAENPIRGRLLDNGTDWLLMETQSPAVEVLVPLPAVSWIAGLPAQAAEPGTEGHVQRRLGLAHVLRGIARDRARVIIVLRGGGLLGGTVDRVGADYLELAEHPAGDPRRRGSVRAVRTIPFTAVLLIRREPSG